MSSTWRFSAAQVQSAVQCSAPVVVERVHSPASVRPFLLASIASVFCSLLSFAASQQSRVSQASRASSLLPTDQTRLGLTELAEDHQESQSGASLILFAQIQSSPVKFSLFPCFQLANRAFDILHMSPLTHLLLCSSLLLIKLLPRCWLAHRRSQCTRQRQVRSRT